MFKILDGDNNLVAEFDTYEDAELALYELFRKLDPHDDCYLRIVYP